MKWLAVVLLMLSPAGFADEVRIVEKQIFLEEHCLLFFERVQIDRFEVVISYIADWTADLPELRPLRLCASSGNDSG